MVRVCWAENRGIDPLFRLSLWNVLLNSPSGDYNCESGNQSSRSPVGAEKRLMNMVKVTREQSQSLGVKRRRELSLRRKLCFSAVFCFTFFALAEGAAWIADSRYNFRYAVLEALDDGKGTDGPISAMSDAELGWPPRTIQIRVPYRGKLPDRPYVVGHRVIPNSHWGVESSHERITPENFKNSKNRDAKRIFVFGGSAAFGFPYKYEDTFVSMLHGLLRADGYVVLNCAECAAPSGKLVPMMARVVEYFEPDTVIIFAGNNEWIRYAMPGVPYQRELDETWINQSYHFLWRTLCNSRAVAALQVLALERTVERQLDARGPPDGRTPHLVDMKYALEHPLENLRMVPGHFPGQVGVAMPAAPSGRMLAIFAQPPKMYNQPKAGSPHNTESLGHAGRACRDEVYS